MFLKRMKKYLQSAKLSINVKKTKSESMKRAAGFRSSSTALICTGWYLQLMATHSSVVSRGISSGICSSAWWLHRMTVPEHWHAAGQCARGSQFVNSSAANFVRYRSGHLYTGRVTQIRVRSLRYGSGHSYMGQVTHIRVRSLRYRSGHSDTGQVMMGFVYQGKRHHSTNYCLVSSHTDVIRIASDLSIKLFSINIQQVHATLLTSSYYVYKVTL